MQYTQKNTFLTANGCCPQRLEQEKHVLRRKLSAAESESDIRAQELETDFNDLQKKMMTQVRQKLPCQHNNNSQKTIHIHFTYFAGKCRKNEEKVYIYANFGLLDNLVCVSVFVASHLTICIFDSSCISL